MRAKRKPMPDGEEPVSVSFTTPGWVVDGRHMSIHEFTCWVRLGAAIFRYEAGEITLGTAAALAGVSQAQFMRELKQAGRDTFIVDLDDLDRELAYLADRRGHDDAGA